MIYKLSRLAPGSDDVLLNGVIVASLVRSGSNPAQGIFASYARPVRGHADHTDPWIRTACRLSQAAGPCRLVGRPTGPAPGSDLG